MNPKRLLFTLFLLYWAGVYGVTFFAGDNLKSSFRDTIPTGYRMFAPVTDTNYDVSYEFFRDGELIREIKFSEYIHKEYDKPFYQNKSAYVKEKLYSGSLKILDFRYQKSLYDEVYRNKKNDFDSLTVSSKELMGIIDNLKNFPKLYLAENPEIFADSVWISASRKPMILPFDSLYKGAFTYRIGNKIFFTTTQKLNQ